MRPQPAHPLCPCYTPCASLLLLQLIHKKGKALILSEYGVGGGIHQNGSVPAQTAAEAAWLPVFGIFGAYDPKTGGMATTSGRQACSSAPEPAPELPTFTKLPA